MPAPIIYLPDFLENHAVRERTWWYRELKKAPSLITRLAVDCDAKGVYMNRQKALAWLEAHRVRPRHHQAESLGEFAKSGRMGVEGKQWCSQCHLKAHHRSKRCKRCGGPLVRLPDESAGT
jgi:hypothetical protein